MPLSAVLLVLASTVLHAGWNTRLHRGSDPEVVIALAYLFVGIVLVPAAVVDPPGEVLGWVLVSSVSQGLYMGLLGSAYLMPAWMASCLAKEARTSRSAWLLAGMGSASSSPSREA